MSDQINGMLESLLLAEADLETTIVWAGDEYPCVGAPETDTYRLEEGGPKAIRRVVIQVRCVHFTGGQGFPKRGQTIGYKRNTSADVENYRIAAVTNHFGAALDLICENAHKGA